MALLTAAMGCLFGCIADTSELSMPVLARAGEDPARSGGLVVVPEQLDFGTLDPACGVARRAGILLNQGSLPAVVEGARLVADEAGVFSVEIGPLPRAVAPGESIEWAVLAQVGPPRAHEARVVLEARVEGDLPIEVERRILAVSDSSPLRTDRFVQATRRSTDVLFVIDNSASMVLEQDAIGRSFDSFLSDANRGLNDFQIGVTTTDLSTGGERGRLVPVRSPDDPGGVRTRHIVTRMSLPSPREVFRQNALVGIQGDALEQGLEAAALALTPPLSEDDNVGFLREEAALAIVFVSDEADRSPQPLTFYTDLFLSLKGYEHSRVTVSAIVGPEPDGCRSEDGGRASTGAGYIDVARALGGRVESICTPDWGQTLARLSGVAFGLEARFVLSGRPGSEPSVFVNGNPRPRINAVGETVWTVEPDTHVLAFGRQFTPPEGAVIEVRYDVACPLDDGRP